MNVFNLKIASLFVLAICFYDTLYSQDCKFVFVTEPCNESNYYFEINKSRQLYLETGDAQLDVKNFKINAAKFQIQSNQDDFTATPTQLGITTLIAKVKLSNGKKTVIRKEVEIVQLPSLKIELASSNPEHDFMWLKLRDSLTGNDISNEYQICMLDFILESPSGEKKLAEVIVSDKTYFPSISLSKFSSQFEVNDKLIISLSVTHKKFGLLQSLAPVTLTITSLWH